MGISRACIAQQKNCPEFSFPVSTAKEIQRDQVSFAVFLIQTGFPNDHDGLEFKAKITPSTVFFPWPAACLEPAVPAWLTSAVKNHGSLPA